jgi:hypothetical protein
MSQLIQCDLAQFRERFDALWNSIDYDYLYISIGGKYNGNMIPRVKSNAAFQMVPAFLRDCSDYKIMVVVIDRFPFDADPENLSVIQTRAILQRIICEQVSTAHLDIIMLNHVINASTAAELTKYFMWKGAHRALDPHRFIIANYLVFSYPNAQEMALCQAIPEAIYQELTDTVYDVCLYQWNGPKWIASNGSQDRYSLFSSGKYLYLYNRVYNYKQYNTLIYLHGDVIRKWIENMDEMSEQYYECTPREQRLWDQFQENTRDLTCPISPHIFEKIDSPEQHLTC